LLCAWRKVQILRQQPPPPPMMSSEAFMDTQTEVLRQILQTR
jgi:hypothetical protein